MDARRQRHIDQQRQHYAEIAHEFDRKYDRENSNHYYKVEQIEAAFEKHLRPAEGGWDLMEIGAGSGIHAKHVAENLGAKIRSFALVDLSAEMLETAKSRMSAWRNVEYVVSPAEQIELARKFDGIYVSGSMHHFSDYQQAIRNARPLLKDDGVLVICEPNVWNPVNLVKALKDYSLEVGQFSVTRKTVSRALQEAGFDVLSSRVLHYRAGGAVPRAIYPYERLQRLPLLDVLSVMFIVVARPKPVPQA